MFKTPFFDHLVGALPNILYIYIYSGRISQMIDLTKTYDVNKPMSEEKATEFMKLMKHSEYNVVDQLKKTLARISLLSLTLSLKLHRNALQRVPNEAYVSQDMT